MESIFKPYTVTAGIVVFHITGRRHSSGIGYFCWLNTLTGTKDVACNLGFVFNGDGTYSNVCVGQCKRHSYFQLRMLACVGRSDKAMLAHRCYLAAAIDTATNLGRTLNSDHRIATH